MGTQLPLCSAQHPCGKGLNYQVLTAWSSLYQDGDAGLTDIPWRKVWQCQSPACSSWPQCDGRCVLSLGINVVVWGHSTAGSGNVPYCHCATALIPRAPGEAVPSPLAQPVPPESPILLSPLPWAALPSVQEHAKPKPRQIKTWPVKATLLLNKHIRLGFSAFAGRDSHL